MIRINGVDCDFAEMSVDQLISQRGIEARGVAVAINGEIVRRSQWSSTQVLDGCIVEIVTAAAGG